MASSTRRFDHTGLQILDEDDCLRLLSSVPLGRVVLTRGGLPVVHLVNFAVDNRSVFFATADGDKLRAAERGDVVAFEVDDVDIERHLGWTVTATGSLSVVDPEEMARGHNPPVRPWAPNRDANVIRLAIEVLEGRRLVAWGERPHPEADDAD